MHSFLQDLKYTLRGLRKSPVFAAVITGVLALGIGANTAIFTVVNAVLLAPLPYDGADRLVEVRESSNGSGPISVSYPNYLDWRKEVRCFEALAIAGIYPQTLRRAGGPERIQTAFVSGNFFRAYRIKAALGRVLTEEDDRRGAPPVVVLSRDFWESHFGGDPAIAGSSITLEDRSYTVAGVLSAFPYHRDAQVFAPMELAPGLQGLALRENHNSTSVTGRLARGFTLEQARAELTRISANLERQYPASNKGVGVRVVTLRDWISGRARTRILILFGAVAFVLLIACVNVANLLLARASAREKEIALRTALGAGTPAIVRQLLMESAVLGLAGGALGLLVAQAGLATVMRLVPNALAGAAVTLDPRVLGFTFVISLVTGLLFGLAPAANAAKLDLVSSIKEGGRSSSIGGRPAFRGALVVSQVALALVLLVGAGLLVRSMALLMNEKPGFRTDRILVVRASLLDSEAQLWRTPRRYAAIVERLQTLPGVESAGAIAYLPMSGETASANLLLEGQEAAGADRMPSAGHHPALPGYFTAMGIPLLSGRMFDRTDGEMAQFEPKDLLKTFRGSSFRVVINEAMAKRFWPGQDPLGKRFRFGPPSFQGPWCTVIGVVANSRQQGLDQPPAPEYFFSGYQFPIPEQSIVVRTAGDPRAMEMAVRKAILDTDDGVVLAKAKTMDEVVLASTESRRANLMLLGIFAGLGVLLASLGIYGVVSYAVEQRRQEFGLRMALGSTRGGVAALVLRQGAMLAGAGIVIGTAASLALSKLIASLIFGVTPHDAATYAGAGIAMAAIAMFACWLPAWRATRADPLAALRAE